MFYSANLKLPDSVLNLPELAEGITAYLGSAHRLNGKYLRVL